MRVRKFRPLGVLAFALVLAGSTVWSTALPGLSRVPDVPARLTDQEFWKLSGDLSEPDGTFRSDNVLSNEMVFAHMLPQVLAHTRPGGVYMGVGPEQNFTYIVAMKARMAFITDVRRANLHLLLTYKAIFELSADRAEFLARLFTKTRPAGLGKTSTIRELMDAYWDAETGDEAAYAANLQAIQRHLTKTHGFAMSPEDLDGVARSLRAFYWYGPRMNYSASLNLTPLGGGNAATYHDLMTQTDTNGRPVTYLGSEENFAYMKDLEAKNLIVPVVGNFAGPKAIRAIGAYVRSRGTTVAAFYVSSVEPYLKRAGTFQTYCDSVATLPMDDASVFIRTGSGANQQVLGGSVPPVRGASRLGTYQVGVVVPMKAGCY